LDRASVYGTEAKSPQPPTTKPVTKANCNDLAQNLAHVLQKHTDLAKMVAVWPDLPEHIKAAIKALVQTHGTEVK
jgi:hypothetical protein